MTSNLLFIRNPYADIPSCNFFITSRGEYALIGSGSVITKDVPSYALVIGNPGKIVGWINKKGEQLSFKKNGLSDCGEYLFSNNKVSLVK